MTQLVYYNDQELPVATFDWSSAGEDFSTGWTFSVRLCRTTAKTTTVLLKTTGITSTATTVTVAWSTTDWAGLEASVSGTGYVLYLYARRTADSKDMEFRPANPVTLTLKAAAGTSAVSPSSYPITVTAASVTLADTGGYFAATDVEGALAEHVSDTVDAHDASAISVLDTGGYYTATDVEGVLAELQTGSTPVTISASAVSGALTVPSAGLLKLTLDQDVALTFPTTTRAFSFTLVAIQDSTGNRRVTWPAVIWPNGLTPYVTGAAASVDAFKFVYDGANWIGYVIGQNLDDVAAMYDTFNRANSTTTLGSTDTGQAWTAHTGTWGISNNQGYLQTQAGDSVATFDFANTEVDMRCRMTISSTGQPGLVFRATNDQNYLLVILSTTQVTLWQRVTGAYTQLRSGTITAVAGTAYPVRITAIGSDIRVYFNGRHALAFSTTQFATTGTRIGLRSNDAQANRWDDLEAVVPA